MRGIATGLLAFGLLLASLAFGPTAAAATWTCGARTYTSVPLTETIQNGGFESDFASWYAPGSVTPPTISTTIVHSGAKSAHVVSLGWPSNAAQDLAAPPPTRYVLSHRFYVAAWGTGGHFAVELLSNWDPSMGTADIATQLWWLPPNTMSWRVWTRSGGTDTVMTSARNLSAGSWHHLEIVIDGILGVQCLYIDGTSVASQSVVPATTFLPTAIVFGDISQAGDAGDSYYDDFSIQRAATPPVTYLSVGVPRYGAYVTSATPLTLLALDQSGTGIHETLYRIDTDAWHSYAGSFSLTGEGNHFLEWYSDDDANGTERVQSANLTVDDSPPATTLSLPPWPVSVQSRFSLAATDRGSGVGEIIYRIDGGAWRPYDGAFALPIGSHTIGYRAKDRLGNQEPERVTVVVVENWKPVIALLFAAILALLAAFLAWRARRAEGSDWEPVLIAGIAFAVTEAATGVISALTGALPIPPFVDLGTIVDGALLAVGLVVTFALFHRARPPRTPPLPQAGA